MSSGLSDVALAKLEASGEGGLAQVGPVRRNLGVGGGAASITPS